MNGVEDSAFRCTFEGEGADDYGGPFRDAMTNIVEELQSEILPLLIKTSNNRSDQGDSRDCFMPNPNSKNPTHESMFKLLGYILGFSIRSKSALDWHFPQFFWK